MPRTGNDEDLRIEPARGHDGEFAVYRYSKYEEWSVLAGQEKRSYVDGGFTSEAGAKAAYPTATIAGGSGYRHIPIPHTPPDWFDEAAAGERWDY